MSAQSPSQPPAGAAPAPQHGVDPAFTDLPLARLADAALGAALAAGAAHRGLPVRTTAHLQPEHPGHRGAERDRRGHHRVRGAGDRRRRLGFRRLGGADGRKRRRPPPAARCRWPGRWPAWSTSGWSAPTSRSTATRSGSAPTTSTRSRWPAQDKIALLLDRSERLLASDGVAHTEVGLYQVKENKYYADTAGTSTTQQRVRLEPTMTATAVDSSTGAFETMSSLTPPVGRGYEYLTDGSWDFDGEIAAMGEQLVEKMKAPSDRARPLRPGHRPDEPVADHPRVDRSRHRVRPGHRIRGRLCRNLFRHARQAGHAWSYGSPGDERHRRPDGARTGWPPSDSTTTGSPGSPGT